MQDLKEVIKITIPKQNTTEQATIYDGQVSKCRKSDAQDASLAIPGLGNCAAISTLGKYFKTQLTFLTVTWMQVLKGVTKTTIPK